MGPVLNRSFTLLTRRRVVPVALPLLAERRLVEHFGVDHAAGTLAERQVEQALAGGSADVSEKRGETLSAFSTSSCESLSNDIFDWAI